MIRRITAGLMAAFLALMMSVPSFASVATPSDAVSEVNNDNSIDNDLSSLDDSFVSGVGLGDTASSSGETESNDTLEDDSVDTGLDDSDTSASSGSVGTSVEVPSWSEAVAAVQAQRDAASASEAEIMLLSDDDYGISLASSVGTVTNTVDRTGIEFIAWSSDWSSKKRWYVESDGTVPRFDTDFDIGIIDIRLLSTALPSSGTYKVSFDYSSNVSFDVSKMFMLSDYSGDNVANVQNYITLTNWVASSGDIYLPPTVIDVNKSGALIFRFYVSSSGIQTFSGSLRVRFEQASSSDVSVFTSVGPTAADVTADYQSGVTSSLGSIGDTLEEIVATISLQLEALWNQMYNYMHVPELNKLEEIRQAIENLDLNIDFDNSSLINKMDEQIANDDANTQQITDGYDKSGMNDSNTQLDDTFTQHEEKEQQIWEQIEEPLNDFEFSNPITQYLSTFLLFGDFLQDLFESSGAFADVINLSFVITIALMVVGLYRFKGGN